MKLQAVLNESEFDEVPFTSSQAELLRLIKKLQAKQYFLDKNRKFPKDMDKQRDFDEKIADEIIDIIKQIQFLRQDLANKTPNMPDHGRIWASKYVYFVPIHNSPTSMYKGRIAGVDRNGRAFHVAIVETYQDAQKLAHQWNTGDYNIPSNIKLL